LITLTFLLFYLYNSDVYQNIVQSPIQFIDLCLLIESLFIKSWLFDVFQPMDTSNHLIERGYQL
jgi:hypothetical protein